MIRNPRRDAGQFPATDGRVRQIAFAPWTLGALCMFGFACAAGAAETNAVVVAGGGPLTGVGTSFIRVLGSLAITLSLFFGGVWLFRNWQRLVAKPGRTPTLQILECRPLGGRQSLWVVGYRGQRLLLASSPSGVSLLTHLPEDPGAGPAVVPAPAPDFLTAFQDVLSRRS